MSYSSFRSAAELPDPEYDWEEYMTPEEWQEWEQEKILAAAPWPTQMPPWEEVDTDNIPF